MNQYTASSWMSEIATNRLLLSYQSMMVGFPEMQGRSPFKASCVTLVLINMPRNRNALNWSCPVAPSQFCCFLKFSFQHLIHSSSMILSSMWTSEDSPSLECLSWINYFGSFSKALGLRSLSISPTHSHLCPEVLSSSLFKDPWRAWQRENKVNKPF